MKILHYLIIIFVSLSTIGCAHTKSAVSDQWSFNSGARIAVLPLNHEDPLVGDIFGERLADALITELVMNGFSVIERQRVEEIFEERNLQSTGAFDPSTLDSLGLLNGVDYLITGSMVTNPRMPSVNYFLKKGKKTYIKIVHLRWIDVESGQIMASSFLRDSYRGSIEDVAKSLVHSLSKKIPLVGWNSKPNQKPVFAKRSGSGS